jgi:hypothetical protein
MKTLVLMMFALFTFSFSTISAQKVVKVTITAKTTITDALEKCKEAGKKEKMGSRDFEVYDQNGKVTLWRTVGALTQADFFCEIKATYKDGITTLSFRMPHTPGLMSSNWTKELKKITKHLQLPDMMVGEYFDGIE